MTKKEILIASHKEFSYQIEIGSNAPLSVQEGFVKGAEWMQEKMIEKAVEWLGNNMFHSVNNGIQINGIHIWDFLEKFKRAMQDESK